MYCITLRPYRPSAEGRTVYAAAGAVVGHALGNALGRIEARPRANVVISDREWRARSNECWIHRTNLAQIAGTVAEELWALDGGIVDPEAFDEEIAFANTGSPSDTYFLGLVSTTRVLLLDCWDEVEGIAEAIKVQGELQPLNVTRILGGSPPPMVQRG